MLALVRRTDGPLEALSLPHSPFDIPGTDWVLVKMPPSTWERIKDDARFKKIPAPTRSAKHLPQKVRDILQQKGITLEADDTIHDVFVKLGFDEDLLL